MATTTLSQLSRDLALVATRITPVARKVVRENARGVQKKWRSVFPWSGSTHLPRLGASITYEVTGTEAEIGPVAGKGRGAQGSLGHIIEFGSINSGAHPGGGPAAIQQAPIFALSLAVAAEALMAGRAGMGGNVGVATSVGGPGHYNAPIGPR